MKMPLSVWIQYFAVVFGFWMIIIAVIVFAFGELQLHHKIKRLFTDNNWKSRKPGYKLNLKP